MDVTDIHIAETQALKIAQASIKEYETLHQFPTLTAAGMMVIGWRHRLTEQGLTRVQCERILADDVAHVRNVMRGPLFELMPKLGPARTAVLLHVAMVITPERLLQITPLWDAVRQGRWADAIAELMLTEWAQVVGSNEQDRPKVAAMIKMMFDGEWRRRTPRDGSGNATH